MKNRIKIVAALLIWLFVQVGICFAQTNDELVVRAKSSIEKGEYDSAIKDLTQVITANPKNKEAYQQRGEAFDKKGNAAAAIADFTKAVEVDDKDFYTFYLRGAVYFSSLKNYDLAISDFTETIKLSPDADYAYFMRGRANAEKANYNAAIADYSKAIEIDPKYTYSFYYRGNAYLALNKKEQAAADFRKAVELNPNEQIFSNALAKVTDSNGIIGGEIDLPIAFTDYKIFIFTFMHTRDGFELVTDNNGYKKYAWKLTDWTPTEYDSTDEKQIINVRNDVWTVDVAPPDEAAWSWNYGGKVSFSPIAYEPHVKRLYYFSAKYTSGVLDKKVKVFSISRDDKKPKFEGEIEWDKNVTFVVNSEGKVFKTSYGTQFRVEDLKGNKIYSAEHFVQSGYYSPNVSVSTDGTRLIVSNYFLESLIVRLRDGAELIHLSEKDARQGAIDKTGRYIATAFDASLTAADRLKAYRVKITMVPDEPNTTPKEIWLSTPGARESAVADIKLRDDREAENKRVEAAKLAERRQTEAEETRRKNLATAAQQANSVSGGKIPPAEYQRLLEQISGLETQGDERYKSGYEDYRRGYEPNSYCVGIHSAESYYNKVIGVIDSMLAVEPNNRDLLTMRKNEVAQIADMRDKSRPCY